VIFNLEEQEKTQKKKKFVRFQTPIWTDKKTNRHSVDSPDRSEQPHNEQNKPTGRTPQVRPVGGVRDRERKQEKENGSACELQQPEKGATLGRALRRPQTFSENKKKEKFLRENKTLKERKEEIEGSRLENRRFFRDGFQNYVGDVRGEKGGPDLLLPKVQSLYGGGGEKRDPPHTLPSSFVTRAVPDEEGGVISNFLSKGENSGNKLELILDSGANETMVNRKSLIETLDTRKTKIITAGKNFETGNYGTPKKVYFPNQTELQFGKENKIVFSENLTDNLVSVGGSASQVYQFYLIPKNTQFLKTR